MEKTLASIKALADTQRIRIVSALSGGELCLCSLQEILGLSPSTVSRHVSILKQAGLVVSRTKGKWRYFSLTSGIENTPEGGLIRWLLQNLENNFAVDEEKRSARKLRESQGLQCSPCAAQKRQIEDENRKENAGK
ncbi:MAG: metalloregulator ArsR/SmtB family transcription factor [Thermovirgaceae bacterium]|nr:metalloregulator ArsR/SmtB family transcription factor [Thermovirgaceae bacterium]